MFKGFDKRSFANWLLVCMLGFIASACVELGADLGQSATNSDTARGIRTLSVFQGAVRVRAPDGYCIDGRSSRAQAGFVVMTGCAIVSDAEVMPSALALITVQVGDQGSAAVGGAEQSLVDLLQAPDGAVLLSPTGQGATISVQEVSATTGLVLVAFTDRSPPPVAGLRDKEWRAFFDVRGRLVTLGLRGYAHTALSDEQGQNLLRTAVENVVAANSETVALVNP